MGQVWLTGTSHYKSLLPTTVYWSIVTIKIVDPVELLETFLVNESAKAL